MPRDLPMLPTAPARATHDHQRKRSTQRHLPRALRGDDCVDWSRRLVDTGNDDPTPFTWTKTADEVLDELARYCGSRTGTEHHTAPT